MRGIQCGVQTVTEKLTVFQMSNTTSSRILMEYYKAKDKRTAHKYIAFGGVSKKSLPNPRSKFFYYVFF